MGKIRCVGIVTHYGGVAPRLTPRLGSRRLSSRHDPFPNASALESGARVAAPPLPMYEDLPAR